MKALLICPAERPGVLMLADSAPLALADILGKPLACCWAEHLASLGVRQIIALAPDRPEMIRAALGDGKQWGVDISVLPESRELTPEQARAKYTVQLQLIPPGDPVVVADHLPGQPEGSLFSSYHDFFAQLCHHMPQPARERRIGLREIKPGVWAGLHSRIAPTARIVAPCWIGEEAVIEPEAALGPNAIVGPRSVIGRDAEVRNGCVGQATFVGPGISVIDSIALGNRLVNWRQAVSVTLPDSFLLCSLHPESPRQRVLPGWLGRFLAAFCLLVFLPLFALSILAFYLRNGASPFNTRSALRVLPGGGHALVNYREFSSSHPLWHRWPQLWNIVRGEFCWVGNRPLTPAEAAHLQDEFEKLWLDAPIGLVSLADAEGCPNNLSDASIAHAGYYGARRKFSGDLNVLLRGIFRARPVDSASLPARATSPTDARLPLGKPLS